MDVSKALKEEYKKQYENDIEEWRLSGGEKKARNIISLATKNNNSPKVLDVGSGEGSVLYWLDHFKFSSDITSVEISESGIRKIKERNLKSVKEVLLFDGYKLPFADDSFDIALCSHVLEHVEFPRKLLREIARVSREQILEVPIDISFKVDQKVDHFLSYGHINIYSPQTFRFFLMTEGLKIISFKNDLYDSKMLGFTNKGSNLVSKFKEKLKYLLWNLFPFLMRIKPNTTTVRTCKTGASLKIMK